MAKRATSYDEQIVRLEERGMLITDKAKAREVLADIGYYRLGFYCFPFEIQYPSKRNRQHIYRPGTTFNDVLSLYYFDNDLRAILTQYLHRIEVHLRTTIIYIVSNHYRDYPTWFADAHIMNQPFLSALPGLYADISKNDAIKFHHHKYPADVYAPAWKTIEFMTFGGVLFLYENLKSQELKGKIAQEFGLRNVKVFNSHMQTLRVLRNICAHGHNLFDLRLARSITPGPLRPMNAKQRNSLSGAMMVLARTLESISINRRNDFVSRINSLLDSVGNSRIAQVISDVSKLEP